MHDGKSVVSIAFFNIVAEILAQENAQIVAICDLLENTHNSNGMCKCIIIVLLPSSGNYILNDQNIIK